MITTLVIIVIFCATGYLILEHRRYERERRELGYEICALLGIVEREVAELSTSPVLLGAADVCPHLLERGEIEALKGAQDFGREMCALASRLPLSAGMRELLCVGFCSFGSTEREREHAELLRIGREAQALYERECEQMRSSSRAFEVVVASCALCIAILLF